MNLNNYTLVESYVKQIIANARQINETRVLEYAETLNLASKSTEEQIEILYSEMLNMVQIEEKFEKPEYISLAEYPETIAKIIYHRLLFFEENESHFLADANLINQKKSKIHQLLESAKANLPVFTFDDFIQGKYNVIFYKLKQRPVSTCKEEYSKMRTWQTDQLVTAFSMEANHFVKAFRKILKGEELILENIEQEMLQLQTIFKHGKSYSKEQLVSELFKLKGLSNSLMTDDLSILHKSMLKFLNNDLDHSWFTLENLSKTISAYKQTAATPRISYPPLLCYSFILYGDWLQQVFEGRFDLNSPLGLNFHNLFDQSVKDAMTQANEKSKNFNRKITALNTADEFKDMILAELERLRVSLKEKYVHKYYNLLGEKQELKSQFISNCIFGGSPADQSIALKQAIIIAEETDFFLSELENKYFDQILLKSFNTLPTVNLQIIDVINSMVPDSLTIKKLLNASAKAISEIKNGNKPFLFILLDINESLLEIYNSSEEGLMKHFCRLNAEVISEYATQTIHELREKTFDAQRNKYDLDSHLQKLNEILKGEFELLKSISKPVDFTQLLNQKPAVKKKFNFGYRKSTSKPIDDIVQALIRNFEIEFLDYRTSSKDLVDLLTTNDIDELPYKQIFINCQTTQFRHIIKRFKDLLPNFNPTSIEKCGRFFSKNGKPYLANNLNPSKVEIPKAKIAIDQIFQKMQ